MQLGAEGSPLGPRWLPVYSPCCCSPSKCGGLGPGSMGAVSLVRWGRASDPSTENRPGAAGAGAAGEVWAWAWGCGGQRPGHRSRDSGSGVLGDGATVPGPPEGMVDTSLFQDCGHMGVGQEEQQGCCAWSRPGHGHCPASWGPCPVREAQADRCSWGPCCVQACPGALSAGSLVGQEHPPQVTGSPCVAQEPCALGWTPGCTVELSAVGDPGLFLGCSAGVSAPHGLPAPA